MLPRAPAYDRALTQARVLERIERGWTLRQLEREPGFPACATLMRWGRQDPGFRQRMAQARNWRNGLRTEARWARTAFNPVIAEAFLLEIRRGTPVVELIRRPESPNRRTLNEWKRQRPEFAGAILEAARFSRSLRGRRWRFDRAVADMIVRRVYRGETIEALWADRTMPGQVTMTRWRRERPDIDAAVKLAAREGSRRRSRALGAPKPQAVEAILRHIRRGGSIRGAERLSAAPSLRTIYRWRREWPDFARDLYWAQTERDERLMDQAMMIAEACTAETVENDRARIGELHRRLGRVAPKGRR